MKISVEDTEKWQRLWRQICDMAYLRENIITKLVVIPEEEEYNYLKKLDIEWEHQHITLSYAWRNISKLTDKNGEFLNPLVVPELEEIYVPNILFQAPGVYTWFSYSFPNCKIFFWEDDM
jgi:hypothetical protein